MVLPLLEMGHGYELQPHERGPHRSARRGRDGVFIITWDNDIFSYHKERNGAGYYLNALRVLEQSMALTPAQALDTAISQRDRVMYSLHAPERHLQPEASPQLRRYLHSLACFIRGAQDWGISSVRYTTPDDPAGFPSVFRERPPTTAASRWTSPPSPGGGTSSVRLHFARPVPASPRTC